MTQTDEHLNVRRKKRFVVFIKIVFIEICGGWFTDTLFSMERFR
jgi:hypothetical protein